MLDACPYIVRGRVGARWWGHLLPWLLLKFPFICLVLSSYSLLWRKKLKINSHFQPLTWEKKKGKQNFFLKLQTISPFYQFHYSYKGNVNKRRAILVKISLYESHLKKGKKVVKKATKKDKKTAKKIVVNRHLTMPVSTTLLINSFFLVSLFAPISHYFF